MLLNEVISVSTVRKLQESKELLVVHPRIMNRLEEELAKEFQRFCKIIHEYVYGEYSKKRFEVDVVEELLVKMKEFTRYGFLNRFIKEIQTALDSHYKMINSRKYLDDNYHHMKSHTDKIADLLLQGDFGAAHDVGIALSSLIDNLDHHVDLPGVTKRSLKLHFTETPTFFGSTSFLKTVDGPLYEKILATDLNVFKFTYLDFPREMLKTDFHYILNFIVNLQDSPKPVRITNSGDFRQYIQAVHKGKPEHEELEKLFDNYLHSNDKDLIPRIIELIEKNPAVRAANEKAKRKIKTVYRGIGMFEDNDDERGSTYYEDDVIDHDKEQKFVASSTSKHAAKNFALAKGHLDSERRSDYGYLITYGVTPDAIILDTSVFKTIYGESEVLIDATKATVIKIEEV